MGAADSKLAFKKGVFRLFEERNIPSSANDYWEQFWTLPESADDVFLLVGSQDIRRVRDEARENLECLVEKTLEQLFRLVESPQFLTPHAPATQVLNCVRVLTRLFPFVFESEDLVDWEEQYFWTPRSAVVSTKQRATSPTPVLDPALGTAVPESEIQPAPPLNGSSPDTQRAKEELMELEKKVLPSHGQRLIKALLDLLFSSGFTLPTTLETNRRVAYVIWETGIGSSKPIGTSKELDDTRTEILRLLLVLFSRSMYSPPAAITSTENRWIDTVVTGSDKQTTLAILCSLINSALKYNPSGWGLPYNHVVFSDQRELLVMMCLQVIIVLLDYQVIERPQSLHRSAAGIRIADQSTVEPDHTTRSTTSSPPSTPDPSNQNQYRYYLSRLHREQDFQFLTDGMYRILSNPMAANSTYLPGSTKQVKCHQETLMLCWKALELNKRFRTYLLETNRVLDIVIILLYFSLENKQDASHIGLVRMCACMLQTLSKDRAFGNSLNKPFDGHASLPANVKFQNFRGSYGDYLICSVHHLIATTKRTLRSLYPALISTLANVSPHIKHISPLAASRLLQLTTSFASPSFLLTEESNHELLGILLDTVCSILYYQASENPHLIYALVQYEPKIQTMAGFTLQRGLDDIHKLRYQREDAMSPVPRSASDGSPRIAVDGRPRRPLSNHRQQSYQSSQGDSHSSRKPRRDSSTVHEIGGTSGASSLSTHPVASSGSGSSSSRSFSPRRADGSQLETAPAATLPMMVRPDSSDSILAPASDGGGHDGDVEDEGGPSTVLKSPKADRDRSIHHTLSEKARGKLPEGSSYAGNAVRQESSAEYDRNETSLPLTPKIKRTPSGSKAGPRRPPLGSRHTSSYRREQATTAKDVGQNGFVPTEEWVRAWMATLRFEPLLMMLQCVIPEIESIQALNDSQVLEYIRTHIIPMVQKVLPESGRPPVLIRKFVWGEQLRVWFQGLLWSQIYVGGGGRLGRQGLGAWHETAVQLFSVRVMASPPSSPTLATMAMAGVGSGSSPALSPPHSTLTAAAAVSENVAASSAAASVAGRGAGAGSTLQRTTLHQF